MTAGVPPESERPAISVVIPAFNSATWLPSTMQALSEAMHRADALFEVIIVDDGSTDNTEEVCGRIIETFSDLSIRVIRQSNQGRFMARFTGASAAQHDILMVLDSRMLVHAESLRYLVDRIAQGTAGLEWNCHVETDPTAPLVGRFWEVPVMLFWRSYLARPRPMVITTDNFDRVPKGTGGLVVRKLLFLEACLVSWPQGDAHLVSDDTKILRHIVATSPLVLDPGYCATYRPRVSVNAFLSHAYDRGSLFVDSYAGTTRLRSLILILLAALPFLVAAAFVVVLLLAPSLALVFLGVVILALGVPAVAAGIMGVGWRPVLSYLIYVVPFGLFFWAGLLRGLRVHRHLFTPGATAP